MSETLKIPGIGAQVWIEPGQTGAEVDRWFKILSDHQMSCARLFLMWNYIELKPGLWNFSMYDQAFNSAEKYGVKIQATLTANHGPSQYGNGFWYQNQGLEILTDKNQLSFAEVYIKKTVEHFRYHQALEYWWLQNEPGQPLKPDNLALERFRGWLESKYQKIDVLNHLWNTGFDSFNKIEYHPSWDGLPGFYSPRPYHDWHIFWRDHLTWYLNWISDQVRKYDPVHPIHVNPHAVFDILPQYDLPSWRNFLDSLGASIHPSWHFGLLERDQYALGVAATCQIIKGAIEPKPFWISELQGGNNIYSSRQPLYPFPEDIRQWVWTGIGSGAEKIIFWCLNARRAGNEAGEWSMLDYQGNPSERLDEVSKIIKVLNENQDLVSGAHPLVSPVTVILSPETMLVQSRQDHFRDIPGRMANAHLLSALAFYETLSELGFSPEIKLADDFKWDETKTKNHVAILPDMTSISARLVAGLETFVQNKNKLIITGLSGYFDENENNLLLTGFPLQRLVGGTVKEIRLVDNLFFYCMNNVADGLPVHMWETEILPETGTIEGKSGDRVIALRNQFGRGEVLWIPGMIGLGAWLDDNRPLAALLKRELSSWISKNFSFTEQTPGIFMRILQNEHEYLVILINGKNEEACVSINGLKYEKLKLLCGNKNWLVDGKIHLESRGTLVFRYSTKNN